MSLVRLEGVVREVGTLVILDHVDAAIAAGDRVGLVGPNGAGKTTLLRLIAGFDEPDEGDVGRKRGLTVGLLPQEAHVDSTFTDAPSLRAAVRAGARRLEELERALRAFEQEGRVTDPEYAELQHEFEHREGYSLDQRVEAALSGMGFERDQWDRRPTHLSGGEQTRAVLARLLMADPELLLLDEPTNHLDLAALEWLEEHLRRRRGALVVASHDRAFLDATVDRIWELQDRRLMPFRGNYAAYARQREERDVREALEAENRAGEIAREQELVQKYRHQRKFSKMHEHEARLEALEPLERRRTDARLHLPKDAATGGSAGRSGDVVVRAENLVVGYRRRAAAAGTAGSAAAAGSAGARGGSDGSADSASVGSAGAGESARRSGSEPVARAPWLELRRGERVGIVGPNGAGKTTLLRTVAGELTPIDGALDLGRNVQLTYLAQLREAPIPGATVLDAVLAELPMTPGAARTHLARFLFRGDDVFKEISALSGGERSRLELALMFLLPANLLLLDEPTNHLDIPAREALESYMRSTDATLLVVSHDRRLLETVCDSLWVVGDGCVVPFDGGYRAWRTAVAEGWTVAEAIEMDARRLHAGRTPARTAGAGRPGRETAASAGRRAGGAAAVAAPPGGASGNGPSATDSRRTGDSRRDNGSARADRPVQKLSKDAYRRRKAAVEEELSRLEQRKQQLEQALQDPHVHGNFVELRRITADLAAVGEALVAAEEAWLEVEEAAP